MGDRDDISITFEMGDIERKTSDDKLNLLLKIAFSNHNKLVEHSKILFGDNGEEGLVESVRSLCKGLKWFWIVGSGAVGFLSTIVAQHLLRT